MTPTSVSAAFIGAFRIFAPMTLGLTTCRSVAPMQVKPCGSSASIISHMTGSKPCFFHDGERLREFVFTDVRPEEEGRINKAFKAAPQTYFQKVGDNSDIGMALATLREDLLQEKRARWPRFLELKQFRSRP
ncbi:hypothetical protein N7E02_22085 [Aliirhizobium terrae]|uniref:hypothetical protein n=1 Tax=Terrirhizobium terrae TaxID=2926709 RepID=UPI0025772F4A|nr:hypothetical protein [Rhizobium sp. CC-CFT758]WJH39477.1 hypothetical protein N7E02_22085 [Rhizobium sp. CC-CFT758]